MAGERSNFRPRVTEAIVFRESIEPYDDFGYPQQPKTPDNAGVSGLAAGNTLNSPDYTTQIAFHQQELAAAEQRGFPPGQVQYHVDKISDLRELMGLNNVIEFAKELVNHEAAVIEVDFEKRERLI